MLVLGSLALSVVSSERFAMLAGLSELQPFCWGPVLPQLRPEVLDVAIVVVLEQVVAARVEPEPVAAVGVAAEPVDFVVYRSLVQV